MCHMGNEIAGFGWSEFVFSLVILSELSMKCVCPVGFVKFVKTLEDQ